MNESDLLLIKTPRTFTAEQRTTARALTQRLTEELKCKVLVLDGGMDAEVHRDLRPLLIDLIADLRKTNELMGTLIAVLTQ